MGKGRRQARDKHSATGRISETQEENMNRGQVYESRKRFVEDGIGVLMAAKKDFESIQYARSSVTDREYIRIRDIFGKAATIEITGDDLEKILSDMSRLILMGEENVSTPSGYITDQEQLRKIYPLFRVA